MELEADNAGITEVLEKSKLIIMKPFYRTVLLLYSKS